MMTTNKKDDEQADPQSELLADHRKNEIGVRVGQVEHFLPAVAETETFHSAAAPRDQRLHLLQTGVLLEVFRIQKGESRLMRSDMQVAVKKIRQARWRKHTEQDGVCSGDKHDHETSSRRSVRSCRDRLP